MPGLRLGLGLGLSARAASVSPNLLVNGDFSDGMTGWTDSSSAGGSATVIGGAFVIDNVTGTARGNQMVTLTPGVSYTLTFTASGQSIPIYDSAAVSIGSTESGANEITFTASASADRIGFRNFTTGTSASIDDVVLRLNS
ncbi:carbohydrate binding domain-containing protein [Leisingera sp. SS27]|uniref:carbohydrate binding domain-containing protein n=1 Tax=Leisingera sp. SS27 TaxID=2979462 RepID=UPI00232DDD29|nr:carbohydrate binding domain-containing protein [Leisingera sp. SS27]MDC0657032.1 carbohydrate binding domain-containing protein [Leisingera sp. SS27]